MIGSQAWAGRAGASMFRGARLTVDIDVGVPKGAQPQPVDGLGLLLDPLLGDFAAVCRAMLSRHPGMYINDISYNSRDRCYEHTRAQLEKVSLDLQTDHVDQPMIGVRRCDKADTGHVWRPRSCTLSRIHVAAPRMRQGCQWRGSESSRRCTVLVRSGV